MDYWLQHNIIEGISEVNGDISVVEKEGKSECHINAPGSTFYEVQYIHIIMW